MNTVVRDYCGVSHIGLKRAENEDRWSARPADGIFMVADGIGGSSAGSLAAQLAVDLLPGMLCEAGLDPETEAIAFEQHLSNEVCKLNRLILRETQGRADLKGLGAAFVVAWLHSRYVTIYHLGDCRAYRLRQHRLELLTKDHTVEQLLQDCKENYSGRTSGVEQRLTQYLGMSGEIAARGETFRWESTDTLLLCSDGLHHQLSAHEIEQVLVSTAQLKSAAHALVQRANARGGLDNITVLLVSE